MANETCRHWNDIKPPLRKVDYLQEPHNFCRNPEIGGKRDPRGPWCFKKIDLDSKIDGLIDQFKRTRNLKRTFWEYCFTEDEVARMKKSPCKNSEICPGSYSGTVDRTISGYKCRCWSDVGLSIRPSDENTKKLLKERCGLERNFNDYHNYCRNVPQNFNNGTHDVWKFEDKPWCYLANAKDIEILGSNWQHCNTEPEYSAKPFNFKETEKSTEECLNVEY